MSIKVNNMKRYLSILVIVYVFAVSACGGKKEEAEKLSDYVNPNIGSVHSRWFFYTPAAMPFGMAKLRSEERRVGKGWRAGRAREQHKRRSVRVADVYVTPRRDGRG